MELAVICAMLLVLLHIGTSVHLSFMRGRKNIISYFSAPRGNAPEMEQAQRGQGNTSEHTALFVVLILFAGGQPTVETWWSVCIGLITLARFFAAAGFYITPLDKISIFRAGGFVVSMLLGFVLAIGVTFPYIRELMR